jgi:hypothetical protein
VSIVKNAAADAMEVSGAWIVGLDECDVALDFGYTGDHAGKWETSIYWHLRPDLVKMEKLPEDLNERLIAAGPGDPRTESSPELGAEVCELISQRLADFSGLLLELDGDPIRHGPTHSHMRSALRAMADAFVDRMSAPRRTPEYVQAAEHFYAGEFSQAENAIRRMWPAPPRQL